MKEINPFSFALLGTLLASAWLSACCSDSSIPATTIVDKLNATHAQTLETRQAAANMPLKITIVGGIQFCGLWDKLAPRITAATGIKLDTVSVNNKEGILPDFRSGKADLLLVHGGEETFQLQAEGIGGQQRVWGYNEHVIVGPKNDPAHIADSANAKAAFKRIAETDSPFVAFRDPGSHAMVQKIWRRMGLIPTPSWVVLDESPEPHEILHFAAKHHAYVVVGHIPVVFGKLQGDGLKVLLKGDPDLRKAYVVMEPGEKHPASPEAREQARKVADYLVSKDGQVALEAANTAADGPWIYPLSSIKESMSGNGGQGSGNGQGRRHHQE